MRQLYYPQRHRKPKHGKVERALQQALLAMIAMEPRDYQAIQSVARLAQQAQQKGQ